MSESVILAARCFRATTDDHDASRVHPNGFILRRKTDSVLTGVALGESAAVRACIEQYGSLVWGIARSLTRTRADE